MIFRAFVRFTLVALVFTFSIVVLIVTSSTIVLATSDPEAEAFVTDVSMRAISIISDKKANITEREAAFAKLIDETTDIPKIAAFALGQYLSLPTTEQKAEYLTLVRNFVVKVYITRLSVSQNETIIISDSNQKSKTQTIVNSQINFTNGRQLVKMIWWLVKGSSGRYKIFDVNVAGVWLAQEQRSTFSSVIANHNGEFGALLKHLRVYISKTKDVKTSENVANL